MKIFDLQDDGGPTVNVNNVPVFKAHDDRNYVCDDEWLDRCVADFIGQKAESTHGGVVDSKYAMLPPVTVGHTPEDPNAPEPPAVGFLDNLRRVGTVLYADMVGLARGVFNQIKEGQFPYRSAEVIPSKHRLTNVSLLGGRYPHFALPVMRFKADGMEKLRYTMKGSMMPQEQTERHMGMMNGGMGGGEYGGGGMGQPPQAGMSMGGGGGGDMAEYQHIAQMVAPIVAQMLTEQQANSMPTQEAAAYRIPGAVDRHEEESDAGKHTSNTANAAESDDVKTSQDEESSDFGGEEQGESKEDFKGEKLESDKMKLKSSLPAEAVRYIESLEAGLTELGGNVKALQDDNNALKKHNVQQAQAAKRSMLTAKCKEIAALGYAIGGTEQIERHVSRMVVMDTDSVMAYIEDVLKAMPKVTETVQRHGVSDYIVRPGQETENERYAADNSELMGELGLDRSILDLADCLS